MAAVQPGDPGPIPYLSHGEGVDQSLIPGRAQPPQPGDSGPIPYLSHGEGVDQSLFQGEAQPPQPGDSGPIPYLEPRRAASTSRSSRAKRDRAADRAAEPGADPVPEPRRVGVDQSLFQGEPTAQPTAQPGDSGTSFELPSVFDAGTAAAIGGLAGATLIIGAAFAVRRQRVGPA